MSLRDHAAQLGAEVPIRLGRRPRSAQEVLAPDLDSFTAAMRLWYCVLQDLNTKSVEDRDLWSAVCRVSELPPADILSSLDQLADYQLNCVAERESTVSFRDLLGTLPSPMRGFVTTMEKGIGRISSRDPTVVRFWRQALCFLLRSDYGFEVDPGCVQSWESRNRQLMDDAPDWLSSAFNYVTTSGFDLEVLSHAFGHHGSGSVVYGGDGGSVRSARLPVNLKDAQLPPWFLEAVWEFPMNPLHTSGLPAKIQAVPKSWKKRRIITIEPVIDMWLQEGWREGLYYALENDPFWSEHVDLRAAEKSHPLCREGSRNGKYVTVDLSAASDSVSLAHARALLSDRSFRDGLFLSRTRNCITPDGTVHPFRMYAPMGNASTFPIETLVFGTSVVEAIRRCGDHPSRSKFRVYGDDIVVEEKYFPSLLDCLRELHMTVNMEKTFFKGHFRETCGLECFDATDVTPLRLPRRFRYCDFDTADSDAISMWVSIANEAYFKGLFQLRRAIVSYGLSKCRRAIPFSDDGSLGFVSACPNNSHLPSVWHPWFQRQTFVYESSKQLSERRKNEDLAYLEWLGRAHSRSVDWQPTDCESGVRVASGRTVNSLSWF